MFKTGTLIGLILWTFTYLFVYVGIYCDILIWMLHQSIIIGTEKRYNWLCICVYLCVGGMLVWYECMCAWIWVMFDACIVDEWRALTNTEKWILNRVFCDFHILLTRKKKTSCHPRLTVFSSLQLWCRLIFHQPTGKAFIRLVYENKITSP